MSSTKGRILVPDAPALPGLSFHAEPVSRINGVVWGEENNGSREGTD